MWSVSHTAQEITPQSCTINFAKAVKIPDLLASSDEEDFVMPTSGPLNATTEQTAEWREIVKKLHNNWNKLAKKRGKMAAEKLGKKYADVWSVEDLRNLMESNGYTIYKHKTAGKLTTPHSR